jgi:protein-L-isoaspartate(D-aspartate) O-methyltransferase
MVSHDIVGRGVADRRVIEAMGEVPRERFVTPSDRRSAYDDRPLPIGHGQTISQPYIVALMIELLDLDERDRMLEIGSGSGYAVAVASRICAEVIGIERVPALVESSSRALDELGYTNVTIHGADGSVGWAQGAPYDAILVSAAAPSVPSALTDQLADGGRLVIPASRSRWSQELLVVTRTGHELRQRSYGPVAFVPLVGEQGWRR